jgi:formylglycine-generating enzyme required for sulfatase activity
LIIIVAPKEFQMKNILKFFGLIAIIAVIGFSFSTCGNGNDPDGGGTVPKPTAIPAGGTYTGTQSITLSCTTAGASIYYTLDGKAPTSASTLYGNAPIPINSTATLKAIGIVSGMSNSEMLTEVYTINTDGGGTVPKPTAIPAGGTYTGTQSVTLSCTTAGASIYYPLAGNAPTSASTLYGNAPIPINSTATLKAIGIASGMSNSEMLTEVYTINADGGNQTVEIEMVQIKSGNFFMGSPSTELNRSTNEYRYLVSLTQDFYIGKYQVTQAQYEAVMGTNPSSFKIPVSPETNTANRPVENVTWYDAVEFCNKLSEMEGLMPVYTINGTTVTPNWSANGYRLPTEAQWEYACRAGSVTAYNTGHDTIVFFDGGWYAGNSDNRTHSVGEKQYNSWGLYDMHGNVFEWCWNWYVRWDGTDYDPTGPVSGDGRVLRGGAWDSEGTYLRSACRDFSLNPKFSSNNIGFRIVRP